MKHSDPSNRSGYYPKGHYAGNASRRQKKPARKLLFYGSIAVCACVFVTCLALLVRYYSDIAASRGASEELSRVYQAAQSTAAPTAAPTQPPTMAPTQSPAAAPAAAPLATATPAPASAPSSAAELWPTTYPDNPKLKVSQVFDDLQAQNRDIVAWLHIEGELDEPVVQRDNTYYLTHNALRQESVTGALFLDENCDLIRVPTQLLIHGHNMKEGAMFGMLKKYKVKGAAYYREHAYLNMNTLYENGRYVIFAVAEVDIRAGQPHYLPFWHHSRFSSAEAFTDYVTTARACSLYRCSVDVRPGDRLLTLSTCTGDNDNERLVVMARKLRPDEDLLQLNMAVMSTVDK